VSGGIVLAIDTTTPMGSVVLATEGHPLARIEVETRAAVSELVVSLVRDALGYVGVRSDRIERVVVSRGPGSFTGIRVGLATARALGLGWRRPVRTVTAFECVHALVGGGRVAALLDARRGQVYAARVDDGGSAGTPAAIDPAALAGWADRAGHVDVIAGSALDVHPEAIERAFPRAARRPDVVPSALGVALADAAGCSRDEPTPLYVRPPDARLPRSETG
jgi:tRNA threonylcarbamoyladenosine biosynthesis protein TsaB